MEYMFGSGPDVGGHLSSVLMLATPLVTLIVNVVGWFVVYRLAPGQTRRQERGRQQEASLLELRKLFADARSFVAFHRHLHRRQDCAGSRHLKRQDGLDRRLEKFVDSVVSHVQILPGQQYQIIVDLMAELFGKDAVDMALDIGIARQELGRQASVQDQWCEEWLKANPEAPCGLLCTGHHKSDCEVAVDEYTQAIAVLDSLQRCVGGRTPAAGRSTGRRVKLPGQRRRYLGFAAEVGYAAPNGTRLGRKS